MIVRRPKRSEGDLPPRGQGTTTQPGIVGVSHLFGWSGKDLHTRPVLLCEGLLNGEVSSPRRLSWFVEGSVYGPSGCGWTSKSYYKNIRVTNRHPHCAPFRAHQRNIDLRKATRRRRVDRGDDS